MSLIHFMRFDEITLQPKNSYFMAHVEEMAIMKSLLYVKHNGQGIPLKSKMFISGILVSIIKLHT